MGGQFRNVAQAGAWILDLAEATGITIRQTRGRYSIMDVLYVLCDSYYTGVDPKYVLKRSVIANALNWGVLEYVSKGAETAVLVGTMDICVQIVLKYVDVPEIEEFKTRCRPLICE